MHDEAYQQYTEEAADWLKRGRTRLLGELVRRYRPHAGPLESLEVGAGVGQNLAALAVFGPVDASEVHPLGRTAIATTGLVRTLYTDPLPFALDRSYDVVCALDVVEHIEDDRAALAWVSDHLRPGGIFVATVPAYSWLFSDHDRALQHFRRYTRTSFTAALPAGLRVRTAGYFNHLLFPFAVAARGAFSLGRWLRPGRGGKQASPKAGPVALALAAVLEAELGLIERGYRPAWGLSVFCVAERV